MPEVRAAVVSQTGLERPRGGTATGGNLSPAGSMRAPGGVPASLWSDSTRSDSTLLEVALRTVPQRGGTGGFGAWRGWARPGGAPPAARRDSSQSGGVRGRDGLAGRWPERVSLEFQHSGSALLPAVGPAGEGRWLRRCWEMSLRACWSVTLRGLQRASRAASEMLDPSAAGHPPAEGAIPPTPGSGRMGPTGAGDV